MLMSFCLHYFVVGFHIKAHHFTTLNYCFQWSKHKQFDTAHFQNSKYCAHRRVFPVPDSHTFPAMRQSRDFSSNNIKPVTYRRAIHILLTEQLDANLYYRAANGYSQGKYTWMLSLNPFLCCTSLQHVVLTGALKNNTRAAVENTFPRQPVEVLTFKQDRKL